MKLKTTLQRPIFLSILFSLAFAGPGFAANLIVDTLSDASTAADGACSLREAINNANNNTDTTGGDCIAGSGPDTITFSVSGTIVLDNTLPAIVSTLTIDGAGQSITISGDNRVQVMSTGGSSTVNLKNVTVANGFANNDNGGAIANGLSAAHGDEQDSDVFVATVTNSTFTGNSTHFAGGGILNNKGTLILANSIVANSFGTSGGSVGDCISLNSPAGSTVISRGVNLIETGNCGSPAITADPQLGPLADNGGLTQTHALLAGSPAINAGDDTICADDPVNGLDQRGVSRPQNSQCDLGSFEFQGELQTDLDLTLTMAEGWRMLSSPFDGLTYEDMIGGLWTQGFPGADYPSADFPNVYTWPNDQTGNDPANWVPIAGQGNTIPAGTGFLMQVYADDDYDGTVDGDEEFDKTILLDGDIRTGDVSPPLMNNTNAGWTLVGNPYNEPIEFSELTSSGLTGVAYVFDSNYSGENSGPTNDNPGGWRTTDGSYGDIEIGIIAPAQGFFVQNSGSDGELTFTEASQTDDDGPFYGKQKELRDFVRLEVQGEAGVNSAWIRFSEEGSNEQMYGDALELQPYTEHYTLLGARKAGGTLLDIAHYPLPDQETEIPVSVEATQSGTFTLTATDLDLPAGTQLYLHDVETGETVLMDEQFEYSFTIINVQAQKNALSSAQASRSPTVGGPMKATPSEADRFLITTSQAVPTDELPQQVALGQNYPNPFNPSTVISYQLPVNSQVRLEVFDLIGRQVATLVEGVVEAGEHQVNFDASHLTSGVYLYRLTAHSPNGSNQIFTKKLTLIK